jgi:fructokinase
MGPRSGEIVGLGEVLWDLLPSGRQLGGAPFNFTFHCHQLGHDSVMVSRVGVDEPGQAIRAAVRQVGLSDAFLQEDAEHPTGTVTVVLKEHGQPTFTIHTDVAYDHLSWDDRLASLFGQARAVCFGTLIQRQPIARATVQRALQAAHDALVVYDVNLRQHYFNREILETSLAASRWVKLNDEELIVLRDLLGLHGATEPALLADLRRRYHLELAALTRGAQGCLIQTAQEEVSSPGLPVQVVDTIGAGDAFTAGLLVAVLEGRSLSAAADFANRLAARVAASAGGTPHIDRAELEPSPPGASR